MNRARDEASVSLTEKSLMHKSSCDKMSAWYVKLGGKLLYLLSRLPLWWLYRLSDLIMPILYYVVRYRRRVVRMNLEKSFPDRSLVERRRIEWRFYRFFCDYAVETIKLLTISPEEMRRRMRIFGMEEMDAELDKQNFVFLLLGHYGNWEWISTIGMWSKRHCGQLYRPLRDPVFDRLFYHMRSRFGSENISKYDALRHILTLRRNGVRCHIGFISDQSPNPASIHDWVEFLHQDTPILTGAEKIGKKVGAAAYFAHITRPRRGYYECRLERLTSDMSEYPDFQLTELYMRRLEQEIEDAPHLWLWSHRRWKHTREKVERIQHKGN